MDMNGKSVSEKKHRVLITPKIRTAKNRFISYIRSISLKGSNLSDV